MFMSMLHLPAKTLCRIVSLSQGLQGFKAYSGVRRLNTSFEGPHYLNPLV